MLKRKVVCRDSGMELLKIIAMILIIISHMTQTWELFSQTDVPVTNMADRFFEQLFMYFGNIGNLIFFICSAWFLTEKSASKKQKVLQIAMDMWVISVLFLILPLASGTTLPMKVLIKSFAPVTSENNWYVTCYLLFYLLFPALNTIIRNSSQKTHLRIVFVMSFLYIVLNNIIKNRFYYSTLILWITIYFIIAYLKKYQNQFTQNKKANVWLFVAGAGALVLQVAVLTIGAQQFSLSDTWRSYWNSMSNPFCILIAVSLVCLASRTTFKNKVINGISSVTLFIYVTHENFVFSHYYRKYMWQFVYKRFYVASVSVWAVILALILFAASLGISKLYQISLHKITAKLAAAVYHAVKKPYLKIETKLLSQEAMDCSAQEEE